MLYDPARHLPFVELPFDEHKLRQTIRDVLLQTRTGVRRGHRLWPIHPKDHHDGASEFVTNFYIGAAGVIWALHELVEFVDFNLAELPSIDEVLAEHLRREDPHRDSALISTKQNSVNLDKRASVYGRAISEWRFSCETFCAAEVACRVFCYRARPSDRVHHMPSRGD